MAEASNKVERPGISRRDFGKLVLGGLGILAAESAGLGIVLNRKRQNSPWQDSSERYPQEVGLYGPEGVKLIDNIENKLNVVIPLPDTFQITNIFENNSRVPNEAWSIGELKALNEISSVLPSAFRLKERSLLIAVRGDYGGFGGGSADAKVATGVPSFLVMIGPKNWDVHQAASESGIWADMNEEFKAVFVHELTHKVTAKDNEILSKYAEVSGWKEKNGVWTYHGGESLVRSLMEKRRHPNHKGPEEDIAVASMLYATVPNFWQRSWSTSDIKRFRFLENTLFNKTYHPNT